MSTRSRRRRSPPAVALGTAKKTFTINGGEPLGFSRLLGVKHDVHINSPERSSGLATTHVEADASIYPPVSVGCLMRYVVKRNTSYMRRGAPAQLSALTGQATSGRLRDNHRSSRGRLIMDDRDLFGLSAARSFTTRTRLPVVSRDLLHTRYCRDFAGAVSVTAGS